MVVVGSILVVVGSIVVVVGVVVVVVDESTIEEPKREICFNENVARVR